jgi:hypothetical protein
VVEEKWSFALFRVFGVSFGFESLARKRGAKLPENREKPPVRWVLSALGFALTGKCVAEI